MIGKREARCSAASTMGGEDGPANVAVGGHGCQFPPTENNVSQSNIVFLINIIVCIAK